MSKEVFFAKIDRALKEGKGKVIKSKEELMTYLDSLPQERDILSR